MHFGADISVGLPLRSAVCLRELEEKQDDTRETRQESFHTGPPGVGTDGQRGQGTVPADQYADRRHGGQRTKLSRFADVNRCKYEGR